MMIANFIYWDINSKKTLKILIFWENLLGNYYSTLNFLSNGIPYVESSQQKKFVIFFLSTRWQLEVVSKV